MKISEKKISIPKWLAITLSTAVAIGLSFVLAPIIPSAIDWSTAFRPAVLTLLSGHSPYDNPLMVHAPWGLLMLTPLAIFPESVGRVLMIFCALASFQYVGHRLGGKLIAIVFLMASPMAIHEILNGNIDWLAIIGFVLPPQIGLFFISIKPQLGIAVAPFWLISTWKTYGWKQTLKIFAPFTIVLLLSFALFGLWPLQALNYPDLWWNASLWPMSIPIGLALFVTALRKQKVEYAIAASPCLSPYVLFHSWIGVLLSIISSTAEVIAAVIGLWILVAIRFFG